MAFVPPADAIRNAIATGNRRTTIPIFRTNDRWLAKPEPPPAAPRPRGDRVSVWHDRSGMTSSAYACERLGERDPHECGAVKQAAYRARKAREANGKP